MQQHSFISQVVILTCSTFLIRKVIEIYGIANLLGILFRGTSMIQSKSNDPTSTYSGRPVKECGGAVKTPTHALLIMMSGLRNHSEIVMFLASTWRNLFNDLIFISVHLHCKPVAWDLIHLLNSMWYTCRNRPFPSCTAALSHRKNRNKNKNENTE